MKFVINQCMLSYMYSHIQTHMTQNIHTHTHQHRYIHYLSLYSAMNIQIYLFTPVHTCICMYHIYTYTSIVIHISKHTPTKVSYLSLYLTLNDHTIDTLHLQRDIHCYLFHCSQINIEIYLKKRKNRKLNIMKVFLTFTTCIHLCMCKLCVYKVHKQKCKYISIYIYVSSLFYLFLIPSLSPPSPLPFR